MNLMLSEKELEKYEHLLLNENMLFELNAIPQMVVNKDRIIIRANKKFIELFGYSSEEILGKQTLTLTPSKEKFEEYRKHFIHTKEGIIKSEELEYKKKDGSLFWVKLEGNPINQQEQELFILWSFIDVTKEVHYREELKRLASTDPMTNLYNRRYFNELVQTIVQLDIRNTKATSVLILDIDKFKSVNDTYGHKVGDDVIIALAKVLKYSVRESDIVSRWGGEEFVVLLPETGSSDSVLVAEKLRHAVTMLEMSAEDGITFHFSISVGVSEINYNEEDSLESAINKADKALYEAKESGRNRVKLFTT